jgi:tripartite-type tricarboxylate transporter receptor subunit TctC
MACFTLLAVLGATRGAAAQDDFYRGKTIRIVVGYSAGGGFDTYSRAIPVTWPSTSPAGPR